MSKYINQIKKEFKELDEDAQVKFINNLTQKLHQMSPLKTEPVGSVVWVKNEEVYANDYNPNSVAPPEMKLLSHSIEHDGYTQPIVAWKTDKGYEVVDGFHRSRVGKEVAAVASRVKGYLPIVVINNDNTGKSDRVASTVRHNRARGKHSVDGMAEIILDLKRRNWSSKKISKELGMDADEVLRLSQITGLAEMFKDREFSKSWSADTSYDNTEETIDG